MIAGVTGHQNISASSVSWVRQQIRAVVRNHKVTNGLMSLAMGADQIFAAVLLQAKVPYTAVLPCREYAQTFSSAWRVKYEYFLSRAEKVEVLPFQEPSEKAFYEAGKVIVNRADLMIAIWDGKPARGLGGTGDIVVYAQQKGKPLVHIDPELRSITLK